MRYRRARALASGVAVATAVAIVFGVLAARTSATESLAFVIRESRGHSDVLIGQVRPFAEGVVEMTRPLPADLVEDLSADPLVRVAVPYVQAEGTVRVGALGPPVVVQALGVDIASDRVIRRYDLVAGDTFSGPGGREVLLPGRVARLLDAAVGDEVELSVGESRERLLVRGILASKGAGLTNDGYAVFLPYRAAEAVLSVQGPTWLAVALEDGVAAQGWIAHWRERLPALGFIDARHIGHRLDPFAQSLYDGFGLVALVALLGAVVLVMSTLTMSMTERARTLGVLRAVGATRSHIRRLVFVEMLVLGAVATAGGLLGGWGVAYVLLALFGRVFDVEALRLVVSNEAIVLAVMAGLGTPVMAALHPAWRMSRRSPVVAMREDPGVQQRIPRVSYAGSFVLAAGILAGLAGPTTLWRWVGTLLVLAGAVVMAPVASGFLAFLLGRVSQRIDADGMRMAALYLTKNRVRSGYSVALIQVVLAMVLAIGIVQASIDRFMTEWLDRQFGSDLIVNAAPDVSAVPIALDPEIGPALEHISGVRRVAAVGFGLATVDGPGLPGREWTMAVDPASYFDVAGFLWADGTDSTAAAGLAAGGVLMSDRAARHRDLHVGDEVPLRTTTGAARNLPLAGIYRAPYLSANVVVDWEVARAIDLAVPSMYLVSTDRHDEVLAVTARIERELAGRWHLSVIPAGEFKRQARATLQAVSSTLLASAVAAALISLIGVANAVAASIRERRRDIGLFRALGMTQARLRRMILSEVTAVVLIAWILATPLGVYLSWLTVGEVGDRLGISATLVLPLVWLPVSLGCVLVAASIAALIPVRFSRGMDVAGVLRTEA